MGHHCCLPDSALEGSWDQVQNQHPNMALGHLHQPLSCSTKLFPPIPLNMKNCLNAVSVSLNHSEDHFLRITCMAYEKANHKLHLCPSGASKNGVPEGGHLNKFLGRSPPTHTGKSSTSRNSSTRDTVGKICPLKLVVCGRTQAPPTRIILLST